SPSTDQLGPTNLNDLLFLQGMYDHGARSYFDIGSVMVYGLGSGPNDRRIDFDRINFSRTAMIHEVMAKNGDGSKPVWASEYGWISLPTGWTGEPSIWGDSISEDKQAQYLVEGYERAQKEWPWMGAMFVWTFRWVESPATTGRDPTPYFAITNYDFTPRPAYEALRQYSRRFPEAHPGYSPPESEVVSYSGLWSTEGRPGGNYLVARGPGSSVTLKFSGTQIDSVVEKGTGAGRLLVEVDGKPANQLTRDNEGRTYLDLGNLATGGDRITLAKDLTDSEHSLRLLVEGQDSRPGIGGFYVIRQPSFGWVFPLIYLISGLGILALAVRAQSLVFALAAYERSNKARPGDRKKASSELVAFPWGQRITSQNQTGLVLLLLGLSLASYYFIERPYLALPALGVFGVLAILRPDLAMVLAIFAIPFTFHPKHIGNSEFSLAESIVLVMTVAWMVRWLIKLFGERSTGLSLGSISKLRQRIVSALLRPFVLPIILFAVVAAISLLVPDRAQLKYSVREYRTVILEPILFYFLMLGAVKTERQLWRSVDILLIVGFLVSALAVWQYFFTGTTIAAQGVSRAVSLYQHPNNVGLFLGRVTAFGLCLSLFLPTGGRRYGYAALTVLALPGLALSFSRGAWFGVVGAVIVVAIVTRSWRIVIPAAAVIGAGLAYVPFAKVERLSSLLTLESGSSSTRLLVWGSAIQMIKDHPIFGVGLDQFLYQYTSKYVQPEAWSERFTSHPHNILLDYWTRLGIMGLLSGVWLLVSFFRLSLSLHRRLTEPTLRALTLSAMATITVFVLHGLVDNSYFLPDLAMLFWFCFATISPLDRLA
ncbi:MAG: O-antigen ligase family protein, partial [Chloroflexi bacterium]|nr:O-antigen ligase family protein [Chloroflexota bacterium]